MNVFILTLLVFDVLIAVRVGTTRPWDTADADTHMASETLGPT